MPNQKNNKKGGVAYGYLVSYKGDDQDDRKSTIDYLFMIGAAPFMEIKEAR
jgi:hypothetical protein